jgi:hypothetical protein
MNGPRLLSRHSMPNGLTLEFWDHSHPVAGDRWVVILETRIPISIRPGTLPPELQAHAAQVIRALGEEVTFHQREERNFIAASHVPAVLKAMQDRMLALAQPYFGHADFGPRFIKITYEAYLAKQSQPPSGVPSDENP